MTSDMLSEAAQAVSSDGSGWVVVILTGGLLVVAFLQWLTYRRQADYMRDGLTETKTAANAAMISAETAAKALVLPNQPWLDTENWHGTVEAINDQFSVMAECDIVNRGPTPATMKWFEARP